MKHLAGSRRRPRPGCRFHEQRHRDVGMTGRFGAGAAHLRPEEQLLLSCARTRMDPENEARIRTLLREGLDWDLLLRQASEHAVRPLLYWQLSRTSPEAVPATVLGQLRDCFRKNDLHNLYLAEEL